MKKLLFVLGLLFVCCGANADCVIRNDRCSNHDEYLTIPGYPGCYVCEKNKCITGDVVVATSARLAKKSYKNHTFLCQLGGNDRWIPEALSACPERWLTLRGKANAVEAIINPNTGSAVSNDGATQVIRGSSACLGWRCLSGYIERDGQCIDEAKFRAESDCYDSGGTWANGVCRCTGAFMRAASNQKTCECISNDYEYDEDARQCKKTDAAIQAEQDRAAAAVQQEKSKICTQSGGEWKNNACVCDANKNLTLGTDGTCDCTNGSERDATGNCVKTETTLAYERCVAVGGDVAYWVDNQCRCRDVDMEWTHDRCVIKANKAPCEAASDARWISGECICNDRDYEFDGGKCVKKAATILRENQTTTSGRVSQLVSELRGMQDQLKVTVWRDEEGKFNTARLASDSIAAVVVGTTGGLVTSHVVKKNQVEKGFEDIQCTVGGQTVAGWGDEFSVGIQ